jgi:hypothetical protein
VARVRAFVGAIRYFYQLLLGLWLGAILCFGAVVAPALFRSLGPGQAGTVVRSIIPVLDGFALVAGPVLLVLAFLYEGRPRGVRLIRALMICAMVLLAAVSSLAISPRMSSLRAEVGDRISELPKDDPIRKEFGRLHGVSTTLMLAELVLGLAAAAIFLRRKDGSA